MRFPKARLPLALSVMLALAGRTAHARGSLSTDFGNVILENIPQGEPFVLSSRPVKVTNGSDYAIGVVCEAVLPGEKDMVQGYEPIPDPAWISFSPAAFHEVAPAGSVASVMTIRVPKDPKYAGHRYEAYLYLHTSADTPGAVGMGVKPRLQFKVAEAGADVRVERAPEVPVSLGPPEVRASGTAFWELAVEPLTAENRSEGEMQFEFGVGPADAATELPLKEGREALPGDLQVVCAPRMLQLGPHGHAEVSVEVRLPAGHRYAGKRYQGTVRSRVTYHGTTMTLLNAVFVDVPGTGKAGKTVKETRATH